MTTTEEETDIKRDIKSKKTKKWAKDSPKSIKLGQNMKD